MLLLHNSGQIGIRLTGYGSLHRNVNELDEVANETHDCKPDGDSSADLNEF